MTQRESRLSGNIRRALEREYIDIFIFKVWGNAQMMAGLPDLIGCYDGKFFGIEVKHPETRTNVSPRQKLVKDLIVRAGGEWCVCCTADEAIEFIASFQD